MRKNDNSWAGKITAAWRKSAAAIIETGELLLAAKAKLPGQFERMVEDKLPFGQRTAEMLMAVAVDKRLRKANRGSLLPPSWRTLYAMSRVTDQEFDLGISSGVINAEAQRHEIEALPS
jgi:hypothetical protein